MEVSEDMNLLFYSNIVARTLYHILTDLRGPGNLSAEAEDHKTEYGGKIYGSQQ